MVNLVSELFKYLTFLEQFLLHVKLHNHGKLCKCVLLTANDRLSFNIKVINWQKKAETSYGVTENVLQCDAWTVTQQDKDVSPEDKVSLKSIVKN